MYCVVSCCTQAEILRGYLLVYWAGVHIQDMRDIINDMSFILLKLIFYHVNRPVGAWNRRNYQLKIFFLWTRKRNSVYKCLTLNIIRTCNSRLRSTSPQKENLNLLVRIKFLNLFILIYIVYIYIYLNKNWKIYWSEQNFTCLGPDDRSSSWGLLYMLKYIGSESWRRRPKFNTGYINTCLKSKEKMKLCNFVLYELWKDSLNSDGQQFHQLQKTSNHLFPPTIEHEHKNPMKLGIGNRGPAWDRHKDVAVSNQIMGPPLDN